jgi:hypothetical protein
MNTTIHHSAASGSRPNAAAMLQSMSSGITAGLVALCKAWGARRASIAMWNLTPDMLRDIGVEPCEIEWLVRHGRADRGPTSRRSSIDL